MTRCPCAVSAALVRSSTGIVLLRKSQEGSCPSRSSTASCLFIKTWLALCFLMNQPNVIPGACMLLSQVIHVPPGSNQPQSMTHGAGCWASTTIGRYSASKASQQEVPDSLSRFELILAPTHSWRNCNICVFYTHRESLPTVPHFYSEDCPLPLCLAPSDFEADKRQPAKVIAFPWHPATESH